MELNQVRGLLAREEDARTRAEEKVRQLEIAQAEKSAANGSEQEHLAHITQLKQVVASQDTRFAKQLADLNAATQRANDFEEAIEKMRQREQELTSRLDQMQSSVPEKEALARDAEQRAFQLETMLGNMKSIEGDYVAQVAALQREKQELVTRVAQLKQSETACEQQARRAMDLEGLLAREEDARRNAEERVRQLEKAGAGPSPRQLARDEEANRQLLQMQGMLAREEEARCKAEEQVRQLEKAAAPLLQSSLAAAPSSCVFCPHRRCCRHCRRRSLGDVLLGTVGGAVFLGIERSRPD